MKWTMLRPREREVARLVAEHRTASEIALELDISEHTVRTYIEIIGRRVPGRGPPMRRIAAWVRDQGPLGNSDHGESRR